MKLPDELKFECWEFNGCWHRSKVIATQDYTEAANRILAKKLEKATVVYKSAGYGHFDTWIEDPKELDSHASHKALLVEITEIERDE